MAKKTAPTETPQHGKFMALKHKFMMGPRVMKTSVYEAYLKNNPDGGIFDVIGSANTEAEALKLCK